MKTLLGFLMAMLCCVACATTSAQVVSISDVGTVHERAQPVRMVMKNVSSADIRTYANLEVDSGSGGWVTWPYRVEDARNGAVSIIYPLPPGGEQSITFDITKVTLPDVPVGEKPKLAEELRFRFRVVALRAHNDDQLGEFFSAPFVVRHPYGL